MPFKKPGRPHWYVWRTLPGIGRPGPWSTGTKDRRLAQRIEDFLVNAALSEPALVRGIMDGRYTLRELWVARLEGRLDRMRGMAQDPPLAERVEAFRPLAANRRVRDGLKHLLRLAPDGARFSWLMEPKNITDICARLIDEGQKPNSVRRSLYRAIADLLAYEIGKRERQQILVDVVKPGEDDTRHVSVTPDEIAALVRHADAEMRPIVQTAILTGIDRGPLARMKVRHFNEADGTVLVPDTKAKSRWRVLPLSEPAQAVLRKQVAGKAPDDLVFSVPYPAIGKRWDVIRRKAGRNDLRFKDLRHVFATYFVQTGGTIADLGEALGHTDRSTTLKYTAAQLRSQREQMDRAAKAMGLTSWLEPLAPAEVAS